MKKRESATAANQNTFTKNCPNEQFSDLQDNRRRKDESQIRILLNAFVKSNGDDWNKQKVTNLSRKTGLSESQVYKWAWDQKKKIQGQTKNDRGSITNVFRDEFGGYCCKRQKLNGETTDQNDTASICQQLELDIDKIAL